MANLDFILQGLSEENDHYSAVAKLLSLKNIEHCIISVAFMNKAGAEMFVGELSKCSDKLKFYVGIRNGVTSKQGIEVLINNGIYPICVDTATQSFIFHPKVYLAQNHEVAKLIVGSSNFTTGGLIKNIESSLILDLNLSDENDKILVQKVEASFGELEKQHPENVVLLKHDCDLEEMVQDGLLIDEMTMTFSTNNKASKSARNNTRTRMKAKTRKVASTRKSKAQNNNPIVVTNTGKTISGTINNSLLWKSGPLTRRDLNIPTGPNTHATGSMLLKVGDPSQNIDQRHYFRDAVFANANWGFDTRKNLSHMERCDVKFRIVIKGIDYGVHTLKISHNSRTDTATYAQNNSMTQIHWGNTVKPLIAHEDLLNDILCIYGPDKDSDIYTLSFDDN